MEWVLYTEGNAFSTATRVTKSLLFHGIAGETSSCVVGDKATGSVHFALKVKTDAPCEQVEAWAQTVAPSLSVTRVERRA